LYFNLFFFQAEDGIRVFHVTGVQTCALPILGALAAVRHNTVADYAVMFVAMLGLSLPTFWLGLLMIMLFAVNLNWLPAAGYTSEIGRASCRARVYISVSAGLW